MAEGKVKTIQKRHNLNEVFRVDEPGAGGACHNYVVRAVDTGDVMGVFIYQHGPRAEEGSITGLTDQDLLEIVRDRLRDFQAGEFPSRESALALTHIEEALLWLARRADERYERGVLGKWEK